MLIGGIYMLQYDCWPLRQIGSKADAPYTFMVLPPLLVLVPAGHTHYWDPLQPPVSFMPSVHQKATKICNEQGS